MDAAGNSDGPYPRNPQLQIQLSLDNSRKKKEPQEESFVVISEMANYGIYMCVYVCACVSVCVCVLV